MSCKLKSTEITDLDAGYADVQPIQFQIIPNNAVDPHSFTVSTFTRNEVCFLIMHTDTHYYFNLVDT